MSMLILAVLVLAACGSADDPSEETAKGRVVISQAFDQPGLWEEDTAQTESGAEYQFVATLSTENGRYVIDHQSTDGNSFSWGVGARTVPADVIIEVETEQLSADEDNLYGIMCRVTPNSSGELGGYAFLISGDGHFGIATVRKGSFDQRPLMAFVLEWRQSEAINEGQAQNTIRAVCVDDYLAIYANNEFLGEVRDDTFADGGQVGLLAGAEDGNAIALAFDNLVVFEGTLDD
ncbi:MAG: hypothetical protein GYB65_10635 [Chloroflexi bacterium]|nr:hypothetical protein [Chloroflexota bacterium]